MIGTKCFLSAGHQLGEKSPGDIDNHTDDNDNHIHLNDDNDNHIHRTDKNDNNIHQTDDNDSNRIKDDNVNCENSSWDQNLYALLAGLC